MGLGKTLQVIALLVLLKKKGNAANEPSLLVVPASLIANGRAEIARFAPNLSVFVAHLETEPPLGVEQVPCRRVGGRGRLPGSVRLRVEEKNAQVWRGGNVQGTREELLRGNPAPR